MMRRVVALAVWAGCSVLLGIAAWLQPAAAGMGTHTQLKLPQCGWVAMADMPCPTCGMTTAFAYAAEGRLVASFRAQPMGFLLAIATAMTWLLTLYIASTGSRVASSLGRLWGMRTAWLLGALVLSAWVYKVLSYKGWL